MSTILYILLAIFIFGVLVMIHELGHFLMARAFGVGVNEFAIGMGPKIFQKAVKRPARLILSVLCRSADFAVWSVRMKNRTGRRLSGIKRFGNGY